MPEASPDPRGAPASRRYDSPVRRQRAAETRDRILAAGSAIAHEASSWEWRELTFRAVAERAGVGERTVYRHFPTEQRLREAVMQRLNEEAGVDYGAVDLATVGETATRLFRSLASFAAGATVAEPDDEAFREVGERRRDALVRSVEAEAPGWTPDQRAMAAGALDVLWNPPSYERLLGGWGMDGDQAAAAIRWLIDLATAAIRAGDAPGD